MNAMTAPQNRTSVTRNQTRVPSNHSIVGVTGVVVAAGADSLPSAPSAATSNRYDRVAIEVGDGEASVPAARCRRR